MQFRAEKSVIIEAVKIVSKFAAKTESIPVLAHLRLTAANGAVSVEATDLERAASASFAAEVIEDGEVLVPSAAWVRILTDAQGTEVQVNADEAGAKIKSGRSNFKLPVLPTKQFPDSPIMSRQSECVFNLDASVIRRVADEVAVAAWAEKDRDYLKGVFWHADETGLHFVASNGVSLSHIAIDQPAGARSVPGVIIPIFPLPAWEGDVKVEMTAEFVRFSCGGVVVATKLIEGNFPDYQRIVPRSSGASVTADADELAAALRRVSHFGDRTKKAVRVTVTDGEMLLHAMSASGEAEEVVRCEGEDVSELVGSLDILPLLASWPSSQVRLTFRETGNVVMMDDPTDDRKFTFFVPLPDFGMRAAA